MEGVNSHHQIPIILGRPFSLINNASINCYMGVMEISFSNKIISLNVFKAAMGLASDKCILFAIDDVDKATHKMITSILSPGSLWF